MIDGGAGAIFCHIYTVVFYRLHQRLSEAVQGPNWKKCFALSFQTGLKNEYCTEVKRGENGVSECSAWLAQHMAFVTSC